MKFWKSNQFKELEREWYSKLEGFNDIETTSGQLKQNAPNSYRQAEASVRENKLLYHLLISQHVHTDKFESERNRQIMECIANGWTRIEIAKRFHLHRMTIGYICRKYEHRWGIRKWKPEQMKSPPKKKQNIAS